MIRKVKVEMVGFAVCPLLIRELQATKESRLPPSPLEQTAGARRSPARIGKGNCLRRNLRLLVCRPTARVIPQRISMPVNGMWIPNCP